MEDDGKKTHNLNEIWRACRKIQDALFRYGFKLCAEFCRHDPSNSGLISSSLFSNIMGKYRNIFLLSEFELREVTDYFSLRDGRVAYRQFCRVVCSESHDNIVKRDFATGLEWNDAMHVNVIQTPEDRRRLCLLLIKIAKINHLPLLPYFQDYELVAENYGSVTVSHFSRVLHFMKIPLSDDDFLLLLKRYMKDAYLVNYVAFVTHLQNIKDYLDTQNLLDNQGNIIADFAGRLVELELQELPTINGTKMEFTIFKDSCRTPVNDPNVCQIIACLQSHVFKNRIRVREFLEGFDHLRTGTVTISQFERALHNMGLGKIITQRDFKMLSERYMDPVDITRIMWRIFEDEIDQVYTLKRLEKMPQAVVESPPQHIKELPRPGAFNWDNADKTTRDFAEEALAKIQIRIRERRVHLHPFFRNYDKLNSGHVRCNQATQVFVTNGILLSPSELKSLQKRYGNELGFNYSQFLDDVDPIEYAVPQYKEPENLHDMCKLEQKDPRVLDSEENVIKVLSNVKRQLIQRGVCIRDFMQDYDRHREGEILEIDFVRSLDNAMVKLNEEEVGILCRVFQSPRRGCAILYRQFCKSLDEVFVQLDSVTGDKEITAVPLLHLANLDCLDCFLNFDERTQCTRGLMKLARKPDEISNLSQVFQDFDREKCGTIRKNQFLRALTVRDMHHMISSREYEAIVKAFGQMRGLHLEFKYREFLNILNVLHFTGQIKRNY